MWSALRRVAPFAIALVLAGCGDEPATTKTESGAAPPSTPGRWLPDGPKDAATVWAVGDGADGGKYADQVVDLIGRSDFDLLLYLGDVYDEGSAEEYEEHYEPSWGKFADRTAPVAGNHEWDKRDEGYEPYWREKHGSTPPHYYAFRAGGWELISLNSEIGGPEYGAQVDWLREQVKRRPGTCRIGFWHRPRYSASTRHGDEPDVDGLWTSLKGHASIVLAGHDHDMQRLKKIDGITTFISGAGGANLYDLDASDPRLAWGDDEHVGALKLELRPGRAEWAFVNVHDETLDSGTLRCRTG